MAGRDRSDEQRLRALLHSTTAQPASFDVDGLTAPVPPTPRRRVVAALAVAAVMVAVIGIATAVVARRQHSARSAGPLVIGRQVPTTAAGLAAVTKNVPCPREVVHARARSYLLSFRPVAAIRCRWAQRRYDDGVWLVDERQVATTGLPALLRALGRPDVRASGDACADMLQSDPRLYLVDARGRYVHPRCPRDSCNLLEHRAVASTEAMAWRTTGVTKLSLDVPNDPIRRACEKGWKDMITVEGNAKPASGRLSFGRSPIVCRYVRTHDPIVGRYVSGRRLDATTSAQLAAALSGPVPRTSCAPAREFLVVQDRHGLTYVELGGCGRVLRPDDTVGTADPATVLRILGS